MQSNKKFVVDGMFIKLAGELDLSLPEFLLLMYFENADSPIFDIGVISEKLQINEIKIMEAFNNLLSKNIISLKTLKNKDGQRYDVVSLDNYYNSLNECTKKQKREKEKIDIFTRFESEFRRPLTGMEIETIKAWVENSYSEELVIEALERAVYNGVTTIRYIDIILSEWNKLGYKTKEDVLNNLKKDNKKLEETSVLNYDWLDDYENN